MLFSLQYILEFSLQYILEFSLQYVLEHYLYFLCIELVTQAHIDQSCMKRV